MADIHSELMGLLVRCPYVGCADTDRQYAVNWLMNNGVTIQKEAKLYWKPVKPGEWDLTCSSCDSHLGCREDSNFCPECGAKFVYPKAVSPWSQEGE